MNKQCNWLICFFTLAFALSSCHSPGIERTFGKHKIETENYLNSHILSILFSSKKVSFIFDGKLGVQDSSGTWQNEFILGKGEKFQSQLDHHASISFELMQVHPSSAVLKYSSKFDHRPFGKNLVTIDEGEIEIPFKDN
jgi:hypothetical protein